MSKVFTLSILFIAIFQLNAFAQTYDFENPTISVFLTEDEFLAVSSIDYSTAVNNAAGQFDMNVDTFIPGNILINCDFFPSEGVFKGFVATFDANGVGQEIATEDDMIEQTMDSDVDIASFVSLPNGDLWFIDGEDANSDTGEPGKLLQVKRDGTVTYVGDVAIGFYNSHLAHDGTNLYYGNPHAGELLYTPVDTFDEQLLQDFSEIEAGVPGTTAWAGGLGGPRNDPYGSPYIYWWDKSEPANDGIVGIDAFVELNTQTLEYRIVAGQAALSAAGGRSNPSINHMDVGGNFIAAIGESGDGDRNLYIIEIDSGEVHTVHYDDIAAADGARFFLPSFGNVTVQVKDTELSIYTVNTFSNNILRIDFPAEGVSTVEEWSKL